MMRMDDDRSTNRCEMLPFEIAVSIIIECMCELFTRTRNTEQESANLNC